MRLKIDQTQTTPPYEQLRDQLIAQIRSGKLAPGSKLPPVRKLATELGLAANTVARSYRELESDGFVQTMGRNGTIVSSILDDPEKHAQALTLTRDYSGSMAALGFSGDEIVSYLGRTGPNRTGD